MYLALRKQARADGRTTDELLQLAALEAFVERLAASARAVDLVLKGGVLLAAYNARRPTRDVDLAAWNISNEPASVVALIEDILAISREDGWVFGSTTAEAIRDEDAYPGVRVTVPCTLASAQLTFHVDVNVGDAMSPPPVEVAIPRLLGGTIRTWGYPLSMVLAEKIVTAVQRQKANTRWRDFADILLLSRIHSFVGSEIVESVRVVAVHRGARLAELADLLDGYAVAAQDRWAAWVRKQRLESRLSIDFELVLREIRAFADPVLNGTADSRLWAPPRAGWA